MNKTDRVKIRNAIDADFFIASQICAEAFIDISHRYGYTPDITNETVEFLKGYINSKSYFSIIAEEDQTILGSAFAFIADDIKGVGPISVNIAAQGRHIGKRLLEHILKNQSSAKSIRTLQEAYNKISYSLCISCGFVAQEQVALLSGFPKSASTANPQFEIREMVDKDIIPCSALCKSILGFSRQHGLEELLKIKNPEVPISIPFVIIQKSDNTIIGYTSGFSHIGHTVVKREDAFKVLFLFVCSYIKKRNEEKLQKKTKDKKDKNALSSPVTEEVEDEPEIFVFGRVYPSILRWLNGERLQLNRLWTLMTYGQYDQPTNGIYCPDVSY